MGQLAACLGALSSARSSTESYRGPCLLSYRIDPSRKDLRYKEPLHHSTRHLRNSSQLFSFLSTFTVLACAGHQVPGSGKLSLMRVALLVSFLDVIATTVAAITGLAINIRIGFAGGRQSP